MKNNLREAKCCSNCKFSITDYDFDQYCNLDQTVPYDWCRSEHAEWKREHFVGEYSVCDDFIEG